MSVRTRRIPGIISLAVSLAGLAVTVTAIVIAASAGATETSWAVATVLAWVANLVTGVGAIGGLLSVIFRWGCIWGVCALVVGLLSNPWLQVTVLGFLS